MIARTMAASPRISRHRGLLAARLAGVSAASVLGQLIVDMPEGYFGSVDRVTPVGAAFAIGLVAATGALLLALGRSRLRPAWLVLVVPVTNIGFFLPALASDPLIAGVVVIWNGVILAAYVFPAQEPGHGIMRRPSTELESWLEAIGPGLRHISGVSLALSVAVVGYRLSSRPLALLVCLVLGYGTMAAAFPLLRRLYSAGRRMVILVALPAVASLVAVASPWAVLSFLAVAQAVLLAVILGQQQMTLEILRDFFEHPSRLIVASFGIAILIGTVLLTFPAASAGDDPVAPLDAFFTATSATCVTGLIVLDTPNDFSVFGQLVILGLIQAGGLGIMTLSTFAALMLGGGLGLRGERALTEMLDQQTAPTAYRLTRFIVLATLATESVGALGLIWSYSVAGLPFGEALWRGLFHAVSAFCNAGFALQSDSIVMFRESPIPVLLHAALIISGGLGFIVLASFWNRLVRGRARPLAVQVRTVLAASGVLLSIGTLLYAACEWRRSLEGLSSVDRLLNAFFQSVTLRTAGFNSVDFSNLSAATVLFMMIFMFIGASPGSTGGGIKTTTATVLLAAIRSTARRGDATTLFQREVPREIVYRSLAIALISVAVVATGLFLLLLFEDQPFLELLFETISAFGTVGLSLGATSVLSPAGKLTIIALMFVGRVGPLTLALLLGTGTERAARYRFPVTRIMVG